MDISFDSCDIKADRFDTTDAETGIFKFRATFKETVQLQPLAMDDTPVRKQCWGVTTHALVRLEGRGAL